jgi:hypothetical protein
MLASSKATSAPHRAAAYTRVGECSRVGSGVDHNGGENRTTVARSPQASFPTANVLGRRVVALDARLEITVRRPVDGNAPVETGGRRCVKIGVIATRTGAVTARRERDAERGKER